MIFFYCIFQAMLHQVTFEVDTEWYRKIEDCKKRIEGRKGTLKYQRVQIFDMAKIVDAANHNNFFFKRVIGIKRYPDLRQYLEQEGLRQALPGVMTIEEGIEVYLNFWTFEEVEEFGILAFELGEI